MKKKKKLLHVTNRWRNSSTACLFGFRPVYIVYGSDTLQHTNDMLVIQFQVSLYTSLYITQSDINTQQQIETSRRIQTRERGGARLPALQCLRLVLRCAPLHRRAPTHCKKYIYMTPENTFIDRYIYFLKAQDPGNATVRAIWTVFD